MAIPAREFLLIKGISAWKNKHGLELEVLSIVCLELEVLLFAHPGAALQLKDEASDDDEDDDRHAHPGDPIV